MIENERIFRNKKSPKLFDIIINFDKKNPSKYLTSLVNIVDRWLDPYLGGYGGKFRKKIALIYTLVYFFPNCREEFYVSTINNVISIHHDKDKIFSILQENKLLFSREVQENHNLRKYWSPTEQILIQSAQLDGKSSDLLHELYKEYNETLREHIEYITEGSSPEHPFEISIFSTKEEVNKATSEKIKSAKEATVAKCGDLDGAKHFTKPYGRMVDKGIPVGVSFENSNKTTENTAKKLQDDSRCFITPSSTVIKELLSSNIHVQADSVLTKIAQLPGIGAIMNFDIIKDPKAMRFNLVDDTFIFPAFGPTDNSNPLIKNNQKPLKYILVFYNMPQIADLVYNLYETLFEPWIKKREKER